MKSRSGLTLIELLVVVSIIAFLAVLVIPFLSRGGARALQVNCLSNLRQAGIALRQYTAINFYRLPDCTRRPSAPPAGEESLPGIAVVLLPFLEEPEGLQCPADGGRFFGPEKTSYEWNSLLNGKPVGQEALVVLGVPIEMPLMADYDPFHQGVGPPGKNFLYADGSVLPELR